jgi:FkbM family methyltransferase
MRKLLNRLLLHVGYRIERVSSFARELERLRVERGSRFKFVQIGANDGVRFDGLYGFATTHPCSGIVVEPLPDMFERLRSNYADYPRIVPVNVAVHTESGTLSLFRVAPEAISRYPGWASGIASFDRDHLLRHSIDAADVLEQPVPCLPLMKLLEDTGMLDADLFQVDTEGYDSTILEMIDFGRFRPALLKYEHKTMSPEVRERHQRRLQSEGYRVAAEGTDTIGWRPRGG